MTPADVPPAESQPCQHPGCDRPGDIECRLWLDEKLYLSEDYCPAHAREYGFCVTCGEYDCDDRHAEVWADAGELDEDEWDDYLRDDVP